MKPHHFFTLCVAAFAASVAAAAPAQKPNVLVVYADQWRACSMGYSGDPNVKTPNFDKLESQSVNFTHAISAMPVCTPFRASLMTGQRPGTHGLFLNDAHLADNAVTIAKVLAGAGYDTGFIGKWHIDGHGRESFITPDHRQGFQYWKGNECSHDYNKSAVFIGDDPKKKFWPGYDAISQTDDAIAYMSEHAKSGKPFALYMAWGPPHNPYETAPPEFQKMFDPARIQLRPNVPQAWADKTRKELAGYYAHCAALDICIGKLTEALKKSEIDQNTILVFTSDHGDMLGSHELIRKQKPWDESLRTPMLWHYPGALGDKGKRVDAVMSTEDVMPTLLGLAGIEIPKSVEGLDYTGLLRGGENPNKGNASLMYCIAPFGEYSRGLGGKEYRGIRTERYTYVRDLKGPWLLYDNQIDPYQQNNVVGKPEAAELQAKLDKLLNEKLAASHDEFKSSSYYIDKFGYTNMIKTNGTMPYTK